MQRARWRPSHRGLCKGLGDRLLPSSPSAIASWHPTRSGVSAVAQWLKQRVWKECGAVVWLCQSLIVTSFYVWIHLTVDGWPPWAWVLTLLSSWVVNESCLVLVVWSECEWLVTDSRLVTVSWQWLSESWTRLSDSESDSEYHCNSVWCDHTHTN